MEKRPMYSKILLALTSLGVVAASSNNQHHEATQPSVFSFIVFDVLRIYRE